MADDATIGDPGGSGFQLPDAPGDFSETTPDQSTAQPGKRANPFTPLTPGQELDERARLNFQAGFRRNLLGSTLAADAARVATGFTPEQRANYQSEVETALQSAGSELPTLHEDTPDFDAIQQQAKDTLDKMRSDQQAYENMPAYHGVVEGLYSLAGATAGAMASPEGAIFPEAKFLSAGWTAAHPLISQMIGYGVGQAALQGFSNPIVQMNEIKAGFRKEYDVVEADLAFPSGFLGGAVMPAVAKGGAALYRYTSDAIERWALKGIMHGPTLTPEIKPPIAPEPPRAPADTFDIGSTQQAKMPSAAASMGVMPEPKEGMTRLYRAAGPGDDNVAHVWFSPEQFPGANEFIDVSDAIAAQMTRGDRVSIPKAYADLRQKIPEGQPGVEPKDTGPSIFENLTDYAKVTRGKSDEPQSFTQWVRSQGGLLNDEEVKAIYGRTKADLVRKDGMSLDNIREAAVQQKWLPEDTSIEDIKKILRSEDKGTKTFHPAEADRAAAAEAKRDPKLAQAMGDIDASLHEIGEHPSQIKNKAKKGEANDIRNRAIELAYTEGEHPEIAIERAIREYGEHQQAAAGRPGRLVEDHPDIPFDTEATSGAGGGGGEAKPGVGPSANAPLVGGTSAPSASEAAISKRLKGMAGQGIGAAPGATRPGAGVASANATPADELGRLENLQNMMRRISAQLQVVVRKGVHERGALGTYHPESEIIRLSDYGPDGVSTWAHELGHHVENAMLVRDPVSRGITENPIGKLAYDNMQSMRAFAGVMGEGMDAEGLAREGFAEFMSGYITNRENLLRKDPGFVKKFRELMVRDNPELLAVLDDAHNSFVTYNAGTSGRAVDSIVVTHGEIPKIDLNDPLQRSPVRQWLSQKYFEYVNKQHPISILVRYGAEAFEKKNHKLLDLRPDEDPRALMQILGDAGFQKTVNDLTYGIASMNDLKPSGPAYASIIRRVTADPLTGKEVSTPTEYLARLRSWDGYKIARWHLALRRQMSNGEIDLMRMPTSITDGDALQKIAEAERLHPDWKVLVEEEYVVQKNIAKIEQQAGLRSAESYAEIMHERNHEYVPLYRDMRGINEQLGVGSSAYRGDKPLEDLGMFRRTGSGRNILSPTEMTMNRLAEINDMANQNMIVRAIRDFANRVGGKEGAFIAEHVPNSELRALDINVEQAVTKAATAAGWMQEDVKALARDLQQQIGFDIRTKLYRMEAIKAGSKPIIFGWDNGERYALRLPDGLFGRQLVEQMDSMGPKGMATWAQAGGIMMDTMTLSASTLRAGATGTPTFMAKNLLRDAFMQFLLVPEAGLESLGGVNAWRGAASYLAGDQSYITYTSLGGIKGGIGAAGFSRSSRQVEFERQIMRFQDPALGIAKSKFTPSALQQARSDMAEAMGQAGVEPHKQIWFGNIKELMSRMEISETAGRVGLFKAVYDNNIKMGRDQRYAMFDAAQKARDFIDYGRIGSKMEMWSRTVPFLNANVQGVDKFIRTYLGTPTSPGLIFKPFTKQQAEYQQALRSALIPRVTALASISMGLTYIFEDDPVYQRLSPQQRAQNWIFRLPFLKSGKYDLLNGDVAELPEGMQGAWIFIPKPWEPASIFNMAERAVEFVHSGDTDQIKTALSSMRYSFNVPNPLELPLIRTGAGLSSNYDTFFQRPIVPDSMKGLAPHLQANEYTTKFYVALAQGLNMVWNSEDAHTWLRKHIPVVGALLASPWSPMEAQYMMQGAFGDWPRELGGIGGIGRSLINGATGNDFNFQLNDIPAIRAFVKGKMAMGEPMNELYNQIGQNGGRLTVANKSFTQLVKNGDPTAATQYFNTLDDSQRDYVRIHQVQGGPFANVLSPLDRTSALASVTRTLKNGLLTEGGMATIRDPNVRIKIEGGKRDLVIQTLNEYTATEARNGLIVQGAPGYKYLPLVDTRPYLDTINKLSPEIGKELSAQLARSKVMPIESIQKYWPEAQRILRAGDSVRPNQLATQIKSLSQQAASHGYEGGGRRAGRGAVDSSGLTVKRGKTGPVSLPAEQ